MILTSVVNSRRQTGLTGLNLKQVKLTYSTDKPVFAHSWCFTNPWRATRNIKIKPTLINPIQLRTNEQLVGFLLWWQCSKAVDGPRCLLMRCVCVCLSGMITGSVLYEFIQGHVFGLQSETDAQGSYEKSAPIVIIDNHLISALIPELRDLNLLNSCQICCSRQICCSFSHLVIFNQPLFFFFWNAIL